MATQGPLPSSQLKSIRSSQRTMAGSPVGLSVAKYSPFHRTPQSRFASPGQAAAVRRYPRPGNTAGCRPATLIPDGLSPQPDICISSLLS